MNFTYDAYADLLHVIGKSGYTITDYNNYQNTENPCILRHDIDYSIERAVKFAKMEKELGAASTYFVLVSSDFYNIFSRNVRNRIQELIGYGHEIGLHFDETVYEKCKGWEDMIGHILAEKELLEQTCQRRISVVSMHRPSKEILEKELKIPGMINSYSKEFFQNFKYVSDSRMKWREDVMKYVKEKQYPRMQILTHAFWYKEQACGIKERLKDFLEEAKKDRYQILEENFTGLSDIL